MIRQRTAVAWSLRKAKIMSNAIAPAASAQTNAYARSTRQDQRALDAIFQHPMSHSVVWREVVALLSSLGDIDEKRDGHFSLRTKGETLAMTKPHTKDMGADDLIALRHFLTRAGWAPDAAVEAPVSIQEPSPGVIVVIDHAGAKVFKLGTGDEGEPMTSTDHTPVRRLVHQIEREDHDRDRDETFPEDTRFFDQVAVALGRQGKIVLIGHGKGQSNEAHQLNNYLLAHQKDVHARIVATLVADLKHLVAGELLKLGRDALA